MINVDVYVKNVIYLKKIMFGHLVVKMENNWQVLCIIHRLFVTKL